MKKNLLLIFTFMLSLPVIASGADFSFERNQVYRTLQETLLMKEAIGDQCQSFTSQELAKYFAKSLPIMAQNGDKLNLKDGSMWTFSTDSRCTNSNACKITIDVNNSAGPNTIGKDKLVIPIHKKSNGFLTISNK